MNSTFLPCHCSSQPAAAVCVCVSAGGPGAGAVCTLPKKYICGVLVKESPLCHVSLVNMTPALWYAAHLCRRARSRVGAGAAGREPCTLPGLTPSPFFSLEPFLHCPFVAAYASKYQGGRARACVRVHTREIISVSADLYEDQKNETEEQDRGEGGWAGMGPRGPAPAAYLCRPCGG